MKKGKFSSFIMLVCILSSSPVFSGSPDQYEPDNTIQQARLVNLPIIKEQHSFYEKGDEDWVYFYAQHDVPYTIKIENVGRNCDPAIEIYDGKGKEPIIKIDRGVKGDEESITFSFESQCPGCPDGYYYFRIKPADSSYYGEGTEYQLTITTAEIGKGCIDVFATPQIPNTIIGIQETKTFSTSDRLNVPVPENQDSDTKYHLIVKADGYLIHVDTDEEAFKLGTSSSGKCSQTKYVTLKPFDIQIDNTLNLKNVCVEYNDKPYQFNMNLKSNLYNIKMPNIYYWEIDLTSWKELSTTPEKCLYVKNKLDLNFCANNKYGVTLNYDSGLIWKMDAGKIQQCQ